METFVWCVTSRCSEWLFLSSSVKWKRLLILPQMTPVGVMKVTHTHTCIMSSMYCRRHKKGPPHPPPPPEVCVRSQAATHVIVTSSRFSRYSLYVELYCRPVHHPCNVAHTYLPRRRLCLRVKIAKISDLRDTSRMVTPTKYARHLCPRSRTIP